MRLDLLANTYWVSNKVWTYCKQKVSQIIINLRHLLVLRKYNSNIKFF